MSDISKVTSVVFGASGAIGSAILHKHRERNPSAQILAVSRSPKPDLPNGVLHRQADITSGKQIDEALDGIPRKSLEFVFVASGILHANGRGPEKATRMLDQDFLTDILTVNTIGPAMIVKACLPLMAKDRRAVFAALSARIGSISDNRLGGWHSYRASKAALNMILKTIAIEAARTHPRLIIASLHPGTVDSALSKPFQGNVPEGRLFTPDFSADALLTVIDGLNQADSGKCFAYDGTEIPA